MLVSELTGQERMWVCINGGGARALGREGEVV